ncbi:restriction endonuclease subunit S [Streptococcus sp. KHUD_013]|uniref:restriction endonuclease subunit S n=1 Tax=Streptococcus sp. KHUD_013 TaxID=3413147 RepID=UPI00403FC96C
MNQHNNSKIRFKGYDNSLERKQIGEITTSFSGGTPKSSNKSYYEGDIPFIRSGEVKSKQTELFISNEALQNSSAKIVAQGDILYALYGATSGEVAISQINGAINQAILAIKPNQGYSSEFIMNYLKKEKDNILEKYLQGGQGNLSAAIVKSIELYLPSLEEQTAIGTLFRTLDDLLASYKDNLANYQSLKATMLFKMFPKAGQTVPEIRLDGYKGEWDLIKLGDFCDLITKGTTGKSQSEQGKVNFIKVENLKDNEIYPIVKISEEEHFGSLKRSILYEGDVLFSIAGTLGRTAIVKKNILPANTNQALAIIRGYNLDAYFLLVVLSGEVVKDYIRKNPTVGAQPNLSLEQVSSLKIKIPSLEEQQAIGAYFSNLDNLIATHQEKISQLETLKKKLLQDMFI